MNKKPNSSYKDKIISSTKSPSENLHRSSSPSAFSVKAPQVDYSSPEENTKKAIALTEAGAGRPIVYKRIGEGLNAAKRVLDSDDMGNPIYREEPDMMLRLKYAELAARMWGDLKDTTVAVGVQVVLSKEEESLLSAYRSDGPKRFNS